ncbi:MAG: biotin/lipoyl-containing protein, partial [Nocardioides sp.]
MAEFKLPDVGEGLTEAEIVSWKVKAGDTVTINQVLVEIETAKSLVELPSPFEGTVQQLMVPEGETVPVGTPIIAIGEAGETPAAPAAAQPEIDLSNPAASGGGEGESLVGRNKADRSAVRRARHAAPVSPGAAVTQQQLQGSFTPGVASPAVVDLPDEPAVPATAAPVSPAATRTLAKPPVRKLAKDLGV